MSDYLNGTILSPSVIRSRLLPHQNALAVFDEGHSADEKTVEILHIIRLVKEDLKHATELRETKFPALSTREVRFVDRQIEVTESIVVGVDALMKPGRTDLISDKRIALGTARFVLMDEIEVRNRLERFKVAHTGLITAMVLLSSKPSPESASDVDRSSRYPRRRNSTDTMSTMTIPEVPYSLEPAGQVSFR